jgi:hypothetical protein
MKSMILHGNLSQACLGALALLSLAGIAACSKSTEKAQLGKDLALICRLEQSFIESRRLMKNAAPAELAQERNVRLQAELKSAPLLALAKGASTGPLAREPIEKIAHEGGFPEWTCPALTSK